MEIDGRIVGRALAAKVKPALQKLGFDRFQGRHAWRRNELTVDLVTFPSMNAYVAEGVGCPTFSFGGEAGVYYPALDEREPVDLPRGYQLTFRGILGKTLRQPFFHPFGVKLEDIEEWRRDRADVWYVREDGGNLDDVVSDALAAVNDQALPFIERHHDPVQAMHSLRTAAGRDTDFGILGIHTAGIDSPHNLQLIENLDTLMKEDSRGHTTEQSKPPCADHKSNFRTRKIWSE